MITVSASAAERTSFAILHIKGAASHYRLAAELETREAGKKWSSRVHGEHQAAVVGAVLQSAAAVEAMVNEVFLDCVTGEKRVAVLTSDERQAVVDAWTAGADRLSPLDKAALTLALLHREAMPRGQANHQNAALLFRLRNALMHAKTEWVVTMTSHPGQVPSKQVLEDAFRGKVTESPFSGPGNAFFPNRLLSADCARWSVRAATSYMDDLFGRLGVQPSYDHVRSELP